MQCCQYCYIWWISPFLRMSPKLLKRITQSIIKLAVNKLSYKVINNLDHSMELFGNWIFLCNLVWKSHIVTLSANQIQNFSELIDGHSSWHLLFLSLKACVLYCCWLLFQMVQEMASVALQSRSPNQDLTCFSFNVPIKMKTLTRIKGTLESQARQKENLNLNSMIFKNAS